MYKYLAVTMIACSVSGYATSSSVEETGTPGQVSNRNLLRAFDYRSTDVKITNWITGPTSDMILDKGINSGWDSGEWKTSPPSTIEFNIAGKMGTTSNPWIPGAKEWVKYKVKNDGIILMFNWVNQYWGNDSYHVSAVLDGYFS